MYIRENCIVYICKKEKKRKKIWFVKGIIVEGCYRILMTDKYIRPLIFLRLHTLNIPVVATLQGDKLPHS